MAEPNDAGKVTTRQGLGGPVVKEAIAQAPQYKWKVLRREHGVWREVGNFATEQEATENVAKLKATAEQELMVVNAA